MERIDDVHYVLLGEASRGTHEYYTWRGRISKRHSETIKPASLYRLPVGFGGDTPSGVAATANHDPEASLNAEVNAWIAVDAECYYESMFIAGRAIVEEP